MCIKCTASLNSVCSVVLQVLLFCFLITVTSYVFSSSRIASAAEDGSDSSSPFSDSVDIHGNAIRFQSPDRALRQVSKLENEPEHDKTNKMTCVPSKGLDQRGHQRNLLSLRCVLYV